MSAPPQAENLKASPALKILTGAHKGKQFRLMGRSAVIGRDHSCDVILKDNRKCALKHAEINRSEDQCVIQSLDLNNPVLINGRPIQEHALTQGDTIQIGTAQFEFRERAPVAPYWQKAAPKKKSIPPSRLILILLVGFAGFLFLLPPDKKKTERKGLDVRTEQDIEDDVQVLKELSKQEKKTKTLPPEELEARTAFIRGFRDYRKGYYSRALKSFQHCLTLNNTHEICESYVRQARTQVNRIIQKKMLLGKNYQQNKQYDACKAAFQSVEIMVQNKSGPIYKEARENRRLCELKTKNKL